MCMYFSNNFVLNSLMSKKNDFLNIQFADCSYKNSR